MTDVEGGFLSKRVGIKAQSNLKDVIQKSVSLKAIQTRETNS